MNMMAFDPLQLSPMDLLMTVATNWLVSQTKDFCKEIGLPAWGARINPFLPFIIAFLMCYATSLRLEKSLECGLRIGTYAMMTWNIWKTTVQGR